MIQAGTHRPDLDGDDRARTSQKRQLDITCDVRPIIPFAERHPGRRVSPVSPPRTRSRIALTKKAMSRFDVYEG
jgi:hypothetical protein